MATYYIDNNRGLDTNDGLTPQTAWKNPNKINSVVTAGPGTAFLMADDSVWSYDLADSWRMVPPANWTGSQSNPVVFATYTPAGQIASRPLFERYLDIPANAWTYSAPNNAWVYTAPHAVGNLCYVRIADTWNASRIDIGLPLASIDGRYHNAGNNFYLYAPAGTNPTAYYGKVRLGTDSPLLTVSSARGWVKVTGWEFRNAGTCVKGYSNNTNVTGLIVDNIKSTYCSNAVTGMAETVNGSLRMIVRNCDISQFGSTGITAFTPDGLGWKQLEIHDNLLYDGVKTYSQGAIYLQARSPGFRTQVFKNRIHSIEYGTRDKTSDGSAIYAETGADNMDVYQNTVWNCHVALQDNSGRSIRWESNLIYDCRSAMSVTDEQNNGLLNHVFHNNTCIVGADVPQQFGTGTDFLGWRMYAHNKAPEYHVNLDVRNNVFLNVGEFSNTATVYTAEAPTTWAGTLDSNSQYGFAMNAFRQYAGGAVPTSGWVTTQPQLASDYKPMASSPLVGAGVHVGYSRDFNSIQRPKPPSMGAFDVATMTIKP